MKPLKSVMIAAVILLTASVSPAQGDSCQKIKQLCQETIKAADEVIFDEMRRNTLLEQQLKIETEKNKNISARLLEAKNPPWYLQRTTIFLVGVITGGILNAQFSK